MPKAAQAKIARPDSRLKDHNNCDHKLRDVHRRNDNVPTKPKTKPTGKRKFSVKRTKNNRKFKTYLLGHQPHNLVGICEELQPAIRPFDMDEIWEDDAETASAVLSRIRKAMFSLVPVLFELFRREALKGADLAKPIVHRSPSVGTIIFQDLPSHLGNRAQSLGMPRKLSGRIEPVEYDTAIRICRAGKDPYSHTSPEDVLIFIYYRRFPEDTGYDVSEQIQEQFTTGLLRITMNLQNVQ